MSKNSTFVQFLYGTISGRAILLAVQKLHLDRLAVRFLRSSLSKPLIGPYVKRHNIPLEEYPQFNFRTYRDFFARSRPLDGIDITPGHLISPCDGWLSAFSIQEDSSFSIKGSHYRLSDLLQDEDLSRNYHGGVCLIFRLCASDYHHYCYIDDGYQGENHFIPGVLHSVQPIACEKYPVYTLNRRVWTLLATECFGPVIQTEIGALVVGGIYNERQNARFRKGTEMGHFELAGSTIVLLFQKDRICLLPRFKQGVANGGELHVRQGMWIANSIHHQERTNEILYQPHKKTNLATAAAGFGVE